MCTTIKTIKTHSKHLQCIKMIGDKVRIICKWIHNIITVSNKQFHSFIFKSQNQSIRIYNQVNSSYSALLCQMSLQQLKKTYANEQRTSKCRKQLHQFDNTCTASKNAQQIHGPQSNYI